MVCIDCVFFVKDFQYAAGPDDITVCEDTSPAGSESALPMDFVDCT